MRVVGYASEASANAAAVRIDAALGYPKAITYADGTPLDPPQACACYCEVRKHPIDDVWFLITDAAIEALLEAGETVEIVSDSLWSPEP